MRVSVTEARNKLTQLLQRVEKGERITICRRGKPIADLVGTSEQERGPRKFGAMRGKFIVNDPDWARPQNDMEAWLNGDV